MGRQDWASTSRRVVVAGYCLATAFTFVVSVGAEAASLPTLLTSHRIAGLQSHGKTANLTTRAYMEGEGDDYYWPKLELNARSVAAIILGGTGASLCTAAGLGGGGLFVPLFNLLLQFDSKTSAALSNFMIVGGQSITMLLNLPRSDPVHLEKPLIDFEAALLLQPNLLLGISVGVILNVMFPSWLVTLLLTVVLSYMTVNSLQSGVKRWNKESQQLASSNETAGRKTVSQSVKPSEAESRTLMEPLLERRISIGFPTTRILVLAMVWLTFFAVQIIRDDVSGKCGVVYWLLTASQIPFALIVTYLSLKNQLMSFSNSIDASVAMGDGFVLGPKESSMFPKMALVTGIIGGMLGIGGAMIINPMLMQAGMHPQVTAATSGFMVVFSSSMSVVQFWLMGRVPVDWALTAAGVSALFSAVGILVLQRIINKYGRASLIVLVVAFVIGLSALLMASVGGSNVWKQYQSGAYMGFHSPC